MPSIPMIFGKKKTKRNETNVSLNITFDEQIRNHYELTI